MCVVLNTTVPEFCDAVVSLFQSNPQNSQKWSERRLVFGQDLFPTWIYEVPHGEWSERRLVFGQDLFPTWIYEVAHGEWSERRLVFGQDLFPTWIYEVAHGESVSYTHLTLPTMAVV